MSVPHKIYIVSLAIWMMCFSGTVRGEEVVELVEGGIYMGGQAVSLPAKGEFAEGPFYLQLKAIAAKDTFELKKNQWQVVLLKRSAEDWKAVLPEPEEHGYFQLRICRNTDQASPKNTVKKMLVGLIRSDDKTPRIWLFLPGQRRVYTCGEPIEVNVVVSAPEKSFSGNLNLGIMGEDKALFHLVERKVSVDSGKAKTFGFLVRAETTARFSPGKYTIRASIADRRQVAMAVELCSSVRETNYPVIYNSYGDKGLQEILGSAARYGGNQGPIGSGPSLAIRQMAKRLRFNTFIIPIYLPVKEMPSGMEPFLKPQATAGENLRYFLPPVERYMNPYQWSGIVQEFLRNGIGLIVHIGFYTSGDQPVLECAIPEYLARQDRWVRLVTQSMRRYPNFAGVNYTHWSIYSFLPGNRKGDMIMRKGARDYPFKDVLLSQSLLWEEFRKKHNLSSSMAVRAGVWGGALIEHGPLSTQHPKLWREWIRYLRSLPSIPIERMSQSTDPICPEIIHTDTRSYPRGGTFPIYDARHVNYSSGQDPVLATRGLEAVTIFKPGMDWEVMPYMQSINCDLNRTLIERGVGAWCASGRASFPPSSKSNFLRDILQPVARGAVPCFTNHPVSYLAWPNNRYFQNETMEWTDLRGSRERVKLCNDILTEYGDLFLKLRPNKEVTILASLTQGAFDQWREHGHSIYQLGVTCLFAGYPATYIHEDDIETGMLNGYKVLLLSNIQHEFPDSVASKIREFIEGGGRVIADGSTTIEIPGMEKMELTFEEWGEWFGGKAPLLGGDNMRLFENSWLKMTEFAREEAKNLRKIIGKNIPRPVRCEDPTVFISTSDTDKIRYRFVVNFHPMENLPRSFYDIPQNWVKPQVVWIETDEVSGRIYDVFAMAPVELDVIDNIGRFRCDLRMLEGRLYAWVPEAIGKVDLKASRQVARGGALELHAKVVGISGNIIAGQVPVQIIVRSPDGRDIHRIYRATGAKGIVERLPIYANSPSGQWEVIVQERLSGKAACVSFEVSEDISEGLLLADKLGDCIVIDKRPVKSFRKKGRSLLIPLDKDQEELRPLVSQVAAQLKRGGVSCRVVSVEEVVVGRNWQTWNKPYRMISPSLLVRGDVLLVAISGQNRLLESICRSDILLRQPSPTYPGPGRGLINYVWDALGPGYDTILVVGSDKAGLKKALLKAASLLTGESEPKKRLVEITSPEETRRIFLPGDVYWKSQVTTVSENLSSGQDYKLQDIPITERTGIPIYTIALSPDGSKVVVGTDSHDRNIKVYSASDGKLLTDFPAGDIFVHQVAITDRSTVIASTTANHQVVAFSQNGKLLWKTVAITEKGHKLPFTEWEADYFAISPDGSRVCIFLPGSELVCREIETDRELWRFDFAAPETGFITEPMRLCFSGDGNHIALSVKHILQKKPEEKSYQALAPRLIVLNAMNGKLIWETRAGMFTAYKKVRWAGSLPVTSRYYPIGKSLGISPDGKQIVAGALGKSFWRYAVQEGSGRGSIWVPGTVRDYILGARFVFSGDGNTLALVPLQTNFGEPAQRQMPLRLIVNHLEDKSGGVAIDGEESPSDCAINFDGSRIAFGRWDGYLYMADRHGEVLWKRWIGGGSRVALTQDGKRVLAGTSTGKLYMFNLNGKLLWQADCNSQ